MSDQNNQDSGTPPAGPTPAPPRPGASQPPYPPAYPPYAGYGQPGQPYGQPAPPPPMQYPAGKPMSGLAIASMVLGGVSVFIWILAPITGIAGVVTGIMGMKQSKEPAGTHKGWGLALGGTIVSGLMWLIGVAGIVGMVWLFAFIEDQQQRQQDRRIERDATAEVVADDLHVIRQRMEVYYIENGNSLEPGGPIVNDGRTGLYPEDAPKVEGTLKISDLVNSTMLSNDYGEYELEVHSKVSATIKHRLTWTRLEIEDIGSGKWQIEKHYGFGK